MKHITISRRRKFGLEVFEVTYRGTVCWVGLSSAGARTYVKKHWPDAIFV